MVRYVIVFLIIVCNALAGWSQKASLGDAARQAREQRRELSDERETLVKQVMRVSGLDKQLEQLPSTIVESFDQQMTHVDPTFWANYKSAALASFTLTKIRVSFEEHFTKQISNETLLGVKHWYESPVGSKVVEVENADLGSATRSRTLQQFALSLQKEPASSSRMRLIGDLEFQVQGAEHTVDILAGMMKAMFSSLAAADPRSQQAKSAFFAGFENGFRSTATPAFVKLAGISDLYTYRNLSDAQLQQYIDFLSSGPGKSMTRAVWNGYQHAFVNAGAEIGRRYADFQSSQSPVEQP